VADRAGVRSGDVLLFMVDPVKRLPLKDQSQLVEFTQAHPGWKIDWTISRGDKTLDPITVQIPNSLDAQTVTLGLRLQTGLLDAPRASAEEIWRIVSQIPTMFNQMFQGSAPAVGVIGMAQATNELAQRGGAIALLEFFGLLSLNLAVVNLLPFPALDGGRLVFVLLEWVRGGKKIDPQKEGMVHLVGIAVLLGLMIIISFSDVQRLISGQSIFP
jgi:regulator of sigma E protease